MYQIVLSSVSQTDHRIFLKITNLQCLASWITFVLIE